MDISDCQSLMEDVEDLADCAERRRGGTISHEDFLRELKEDGIISNLEGESPSNLRNS